MNTSSWNGTWARLLSRREYPNLASRRKTEGERERKREREMGTYREQLLARGGSTIFNARKLHQLVDTGGMGLCGIPPRDRALLVFPRLGSGFETGCTSSLACVRAYWVSGNLWRERER